jgi:hypothetical protein
MNHELQILYQYYLFITMQQEPFQLTDGSLGSDNILVTKRHYLMIHGWVLWATWGVLGFFLIWTGRYLRAHWKASLWIHVVLGTIALILNFLYGLGAIYWLGWRVKASIHGIVGTMLSILQVIGCI